jgi:uncharacterized protein with von Willebrand factor type A (vWA) domain
MIQRITSLTEQITDFGRFLRGKGFDISPDREALALKAIGTELHRKKEFKLALKSVFTTDNKTFESFDQHFDHYFTERKKGVNSKIKEQAQENQKKKRTPQSEAAFKSLKNWMNGNRSVEDELAAYGGDLKLTEKDLSSYTDEDLKASEELVKQLARRIKRKPGRRKTTTKRASQPDLRATLRKNLKRGLEINELVFTQAKPKPVRIVLLTDVSRSMEVYSRFFVQFMYAFEKVYPKIDTYVFSSSLTKISDEIHGKDFKKAFANLGDYVPYWSGGTKIGKSLNEFVSKKINQRINSKTIVIIVSDGLDTGEPTLVGQALKAIKKRAKKVVWINPLAGNPDYQPKAAAMQAALPFIDTFSSGHNLESLKSLVLKDL